MTFPFQCFVFILFNFILFLFFFVCVCVWAVTGPGTYFGIWDLFHKTWWRHQMETFSALLALCAGNSPVTGEFPHKGHWRGTLMFSLICALTYNWVNNKDAGDLRRHRAHYDVTVMMFMIWPHNWNLVNDNCFICSCRDICKIVTWSKHYFSRKNSVDFYNVWIVLRELINLLCYGSVSIDPSGNERHLVGEINISLVEIKNEKCCAISRHQGQGQVIASHSIYRQVSNIRRTLVGNYIVDHSDVVGASPVGAAPTTSSFST